MWYGLFGLEIYWNSVDIIGDSDHVRIACNFM